MTHVLAPPEEQGTASSAVTPIASTGGPIAEAGATAAAARHPDRYKWIVLSNTTVGTLVASINGSIMMISLPAIFRGIALDPMAPGNSGFLLWIMMGYMLVTATLLVTFGRISDMFGRVRLYNLGFAVFTLGSLLLVFTPGTGTQAGIELLVFRVVQGIGGAFLFSNSAALLTDAFPPDERGMAMGFNQIAGISGSLGGLLIGGWLATVDWRLVFLVSVPFGLFGTVWAYLRLHEIATIHRGQRLDLPGNVTFLVGLTLLLVGVTYGIEPYGGGALGWTNPWVIAALVTGAVLLAAFLWIEARVPDPLFHLELFKIRMFAAGNLSGFLSALARGGLQFMLIIWLQGIWLPLHGINYEDTPLWAGIYTMPMMLGFIGLGPVSGWLSDRYGARAFATGGMALNAVGFVLLNALPGDFNRLAFFAILLLMGVGQGLFAAPNTTSIMNSVPADVRGVASGMRGTFLNAGMMVSMAFFFTILTAGLASTLPGVMAAGLMAHGLPVSVAHRIAGLPPISVLFAALLGYNPMRSLVPPAVATHLGLQTQATLFGKTFFPHLILPAFMDGLHTAFYVSAVLSVIAAVASLMRGKRYIHDMDEESDRA